MRRVRAAGSSRRNGGERCWWLGPKQFQEGVKNKPRVLCLSSYHDELNRKCHRRGDLWVEEQKTSSGQVEFEMPIRHPSADVEWPLYTRRAPKMN